METRTPGKSPDLCPEIKVTTPNTYVYVNSWKRQGLTPLINKTLGFVDKTSRQMGETFTKRFANYQRNTRGKEDDRILDYLIRTNMNRPQFALFDSKYAREFLCEAGFTNEYIDKDSLLLVFQFPKPLAQFWFKSGLKIERKDQVKPLVRKTVREMLFSAEHPAFENERFEHILGDYKRDSKLKPIEWGRFIRPLKLQIWENVALYSQRRSKELEFQRINGRGDHDVDMYHYMWEVKFPNRNKPGNGNGKH